MEFGDAGARSLRIEASLGTRLVVEMRFEMSDLLPINEVGPRDGLQSQPRLVSCSDKLRLIEVLVSAGIRSIEATSFVSPKAVPGMTVLLNRPVKIGSHPALLVIDATRGFTDPSAPTRSCFGSDQRFKMARKH
ncbi:MAG TPA: hypothetical protein VGE08_15145 [Steroidobacter sp.]